MVLSRAALTLLPLQLLHHPVRPHVTPTALGHVGALKMSVRTPATVRAKADAGIVTTVGASAATGTATSRGTGVEEEEEDGTDQGSAHHHEEEEEEAMADMTIAIIETTITEEEEGEVRVQHARFRDLTPPPAALLSRTAHHPPPLFFALQAARGPALAPHRAAEEAEGAPHVPTPPERAVPAARPPLPLTTRMPSKRPWPPPVRV